MADEFISTVSIIIEAYISLIADKYEELRLTTMNVNFIRMNYACEIARRDVLYVNFRDYKVEWKN